MTRPPTILALACLALAAGITAADAASFDCAKAAKPDEKAICATPALSDLDVEMATLYGVRMEIPMMMGAKGAAQDEQVAFLQQRAACGSDTACIASAYSARIATLKQTIADAMKDYCNKIGLCG
jgi:uncharacterized protein